MLKRFTCRAILFIMTMGSGFTSFAEAKGEEPPVSQSYQSVLDCFPDLKNDKISFKVDLSVLKETIDSVYLTLDSRMVERQVFLTSMQGEKTRLTLRAHRDSKSFKMNHYLSLDRVNPKGEYEAIELTPSQKKNPHSSVLANLIGNKTVDADRYTYDDLKINSVRLLSTRNFKAVEELELEDAKRNRYLKCKKDSGELIICSCSKK